MLTRKPHIHDLLYLLAEIDYSWSKIGFALYVDNNIIQGLYTQNEDNITKLTKVLNKWIDSQSCPVTWENIITAVEGPIVGNYKSIGDKIREHLFKPEVFSGYK